MDEHSASQVPQREHGQTPPMQSEHIEHGQRGQHGVNEAESQVGKRAPGAGNPGNFANNREKAVEAGRRGGQHSHGGGGAGNNPGNFANNRQRAAEAGRKGGMQPRR